MQILPFFCGKLKSLYKITSIRILSPNPGERARLDRSSPCAVVINDVVNCFDTSVVHVRRREHYVSQRGRLEFANVVGVLSELIDSRVGNGIGSLPFQVVKARVVKLDLGKPFLEVVHSPREIEPAMTVEALKLLTEEKEFSPLCGFRNCIWIPPTCISVVG